MKELGALLLAKSDDIINAWTSKVRDSVGSSYEAAITYESIRSRLPLILQAIAARFTDRSCVAAEQSTQPCLDQPQSNLSNLDLSDGLSDDLSNRLAIKVELGFDIDEMLRELSILRTLSIAALTSELEISELQTSELQISKLQTDNVEAPELQTSELQIFESQTAKAERSASAAQLCQSRADRAVSHSWQVALFHIDSVLNALVASSTKRHTAYRLEQLEPRHLELLSSNQEMIRLVQMQKDNASYLAHELKNPLHAIASLSSLLLKNQTKTVAADPAREREFLQIKKIYENSKQISRLIENMLEVSRKESQASSLKLEPINVAELVEKVVESLASVATEKGIALRVACELAPPQIVTDSLRLQQIIVNLVSNAIRYTDRGKVQVECCSEGDKYWRLSICDTGRGISLEQQQKIFTPYFRAGQAASYAADSTGLGLAIVSELVALLQGKVELTSTVGVGSTFTVVLPISAEAER